MEDSAAVLVYHLDKIACFQASRHKHYSIGDSVRKESRYHTENVEERQDEAGSVLGIEAKAFCIGTGGVQNIIS